MTSASPDLLRTLASVAPGTRVVDVAAGDGVHAHALARLGFDVWASSASPAGAEATRERLADVLGPDDAARRVAVARPDALGYPDAFAPWLVASRLSPDGLAEAFVEARRVLAPGGWLWAEVDGAAPASASAAALSVAARLAADKQAARALADAAEAAHLAVASLPTADTDRGTVVVVFRRVDADTVG